MWQLQQVFPLSDATQQTYFPAPEAICQSEKGENMGREVTGKEESVKAKNCTCRGSE